MTTLVPAEGVTLDRVLEAEHAISPGGLSREAYAKCEAAVMRTAWARRHRRRFALVDGADVLASATAYDLAAVFEQEPVRACGLGAILTPSAHRGRGAAMELVDRLLDEAARKGATIALLCSHISDEYQPAGFDAVAMTGAELRVAESPRHGAPMTLIRGGEARDMAAIAAMGQVRANAFRFHLARDVDFVQHAITKRRLLAGLGQAGSRELHFFIAEEGITAAAYVVVSVVGRTWTIEECGDRDPAGARVGAILQALLAREPVERRPTIRAWLPHGFVPPQVTIVSAKPAPEGLRVRFLGAKAGQRGLSADDVLYWRTDIF